MIIKSIKVVITVDNESAEFGVQHAEPDEDLVPHALLPMLEEVKELILSSTKRSGGMKDRDMPRYTLKEKIIKFINGEI
jgi:hypothetical protein